MLFYEIKHMVLQVSPQKRVIMTKNEEKSIFKHFLYRGYKFQLF